MRIKLLGVVDRVPETSGWGVCFREGGRMLRLRPQPPGGATVVFELHERQIDPVWLAQLKQGHGPLLRNYASVAAPDLTPGWSVRAPARASMTPGWSVRGDGVPFVPAAVLSSKAGASVPLRTSGTAVADEWRRDP